LNYGVLFTAWGAAGTLGPGIAGRVFDRFGDYRYAFFAAAVFAVIALISLSMAKVPTLETVPAQPRTGPLSTSVGRS
jgi:OFA family oxalate/formate antiporter-like MFS transporter